MRGTSLIRSAWGFVAGALVLVAPAAAMAQYYEPGPPAVGGGLWH